MTISPRVAVIDYGLCNIDSVARAVVECGGTAIITDRAEEILLATHIVLPGVGSFTDAMQNIRKASLDVILKKRVEEERIPFLGICLGMQLLATKGWEGGETQGLGWIAGEVRRLEPPDPSVRIPHVGWNTVEQVRSSPLLAGVASGKDFYFVHSYAFKPEDASVISGTCSYGEDFVAAVEKNRVCATQFHPEKSQKAGLQVLTNFIERYVRC